MAKVVSKKNKFYTLMIIPHAKDKVSKMQFPRWGVHLLLGMVGIIFFTAAYFVYTYSKLSTEVQELEQLRQVAQEQQGQIISLEAKVEELNDETINMQTKLAEVKELEVVIREMVGLEQRKELGDQLELAVPRVQAFTASRGGEYTVFPEDVLGNLESIDMIIESTTEDLSQLMSDVAKRLEYLEAVPSRWPVNGRVTSGFGFRKSPFGGGREFHNGIDIAAPTGTQVKAAGKGMVVFAGTRVGYGRTVIIDHGYGLKSLYAHNTSLAVKAGQWVEANQVIARVGSTGRSTGPHLHFTVELNGKAVNPFNYL
ncbi:MAG: peptidoglycan DD-metalloendopeptidase family protein [Clostridia bacterium]|nr:peptidoglycan DD-metalloendopeptidase family protein [Clostridia bacterium]